MNFKVLKGSQKIAKSFYQKGSLTPRVFSSIVTHLFQE